ncbi:hypothetical protein OSTOST_24451 [Ostertagia ostertagi]
MESGDIYATKFAHVGALKLDRRLKGPVRHSMEGENTHSLHCVQFDPALNEIVDIGTNVEVASAGPTETETGLRTDDKGNAVSPGNRTPAAAAQQSLRGI